MSSKHSVGGNSGSVSPGTTGTGTRTTGLDQSRDNSHLTDLSHISRLTPLPPKPLHPHHHHPHHLHNNISQHSLQHHHHHHHHLSHLNHNSNNSSINSHVNNTTINTSSNIDPYHPSHRNMVMKGNEFTPTGGLIPRFLHAARRSSSSGALLQSLGLLCLISLLLALLALTFLLELTPDAVASSGSDGAVPRGRGVIQEVTLALAALTLSLDLFCVLVCAAQFIFAVKLTKDNTGDDRAARYLRQSSLSRVSAIAGFFLSVPLLLTGVIVHTFLVLHSVPAILTSAFIGAGIILCGAAMIHNVLVWQKHKSRSMSQENIHRGLATDPRRLHHKHSNGPTPPHHLHSTSSPLPPTTVDLSATMNPAHELSTLV